MTSLTPPAAILRDLIRCPSVTPEEGGALTYLQTRLDALGFRTVRKTFSAPGTPDVENLYARLGEAAPNLCFAGHTDVVPVGDETAWSHGPFGGDVSDGIMFGRGAVDMKGGIACFLAAVEAHLAAGKPIAGSISLLITGDEEGPAINGTKAILDWLVQQGEGIEACIVGEPTNANHLGDTIKIGRRGSVSGTITVEGVQGHAAYPHLADNPVRGMTMLIDGLLWEPFDEGTDAFQPTNLEVTSVDVGNPSFNVIAARATATFNVRFNDTWTADTIKQEIEQRLARAAREERLRKPEKGGRRPPVSYSIAYTERPSHVFLTRDDALIAALSSSVEAVTGQAPALTTGGGTSDARFIKDVCPVVEFGLVGQTMHQVDEHVPLADLDQLTAVYERFLEDYLGRAT
ncbi:succinyl-diaminopimelate desuccinylase [Pseudahrensia aquimaris]|uniref:Succinyl-diaminopimelate desuccinylase n=1 Tax=Pseudahrensia aquimaris TaxID=744461 RepID=A0ABW3FEX7_9HYPH